MAVAALGWCAQLVKARQLMLGIARAAREGKYRGLERGTTRCKMAVNGIGRLERARRNLCCLPGWRVCDQRAAIPSENGGSRMGWNGGATESRQGIPSSGRDSEWGKQGSGS